jgi:hypothetical protein
MPQDMSTLVIRLPRICSNCPVVSGVDPSFQRCWLMGMSIEGVRPAAVAVKVRSQTLVAVVNASAAQLSVLSVKSIFEQAGMTIRLVRSDSVLTAA